MVKATDERKETAWKEVLGDRDGVAKDRCMEFYKEKRKVIKGVYITTKRFRIGTLYDPCMSYEVTKWSRVAGLDTHSLFLSFCSFF